VTKFYRPGTLDPLPPLAIDDVDLHSYVSGLPNRQILVEFPPPLSVVRRRRDVNLQLVGPRLFRDAVGPPQVFLQAPQSGIVADKDVQGRSNAPELAASKTFHLSVTNGVDAVKPHSGDTVAASALGGPRA
jgi:hypothetical protein